MIDLENNLLKAKKKYFNNNKSLIVYTLSKRTLAYTIKSCIDL